MNERLKDILLPVPNASSQSNRQPLTHLPDFTAPLHERLPPEIFGAIIHLCLGFTTPVRDLVTLQLVCRSWHDIIADASFLWGTINAAEGLLAVHKALQMAKDASLDINYLSKTSRINQTEFFKLAREGIHQWRSLVVDSTEWQSALDDLRAQKPPRLEKLHVATKYYKEPPSNEEIVLFGGDPCPGLKEVRLACVPIHPASLHLSGLKSLELNQIPSISAVEIVTLITESPALEILTLRSLDTLLPPHSAQPDLVPNPPIHLAFLTKLSLDYLPLPFLNFFLSLVTVPQLRLLEIGCHLENPASQLVALGTERLGPIMNSIASNPQMYKVAIGFGDFYKFRIGKLLISISCDAFSTNHFQETFIWLSGHLKTSLPDSPLHLELKGSNPKASYLEWFTRHTNVTALTLHGNPFIENSLEEIMPILGRPRSAPHSPPTWLLPQVEVFQASMVRVEGDPAIVDMVEGRHAASRGSPAAEVNRVIPKRFREIRLDYGRKGVPRPLPDAGFMLKVVQVADGADVYWEGKKWIVS